MNLDKALADYSTGDNFLRDSFNYEIAQECCVALFKEGLPVGWGNDNTPAVEAAKRTLHATLLERFKLSPEKMKETVDSISSWLGSQHGLPVLSRIAIETVRGKIKHLKPELLTPEK